MSNDIYQPSAPVCANPGCGNLVTEKTKKHNVWKMHCCNECKGSHIRLKSQEKSRKTCLERYGAETPLQSTKIKNKIKDTCIEKYGVDNASKASCVIYKIKTLANERWTDKDTKVAMMNKRKATNLEKYGTEFAQQSDIVKQRIEDNCMEKYGVKSTLLVPEIRAQQRKTCLENHGSETPFASETIRNKGQDTLELRYGVRYPLQNKEIFDKTKKTFKDRFRLKDYTLPSGKIIQIQGYENRAITDLLKTYAETDIVVDAVPTIKYTTPDNKTHTYYPDIFIPKENLIIEVKSTYTYGRFIDINVLKEKACVAAGFNFRWMIY